MYNNRLDTLPTSRRTRDVKNERGPIGLFSATYPSHLQPHSDRVVVLGTDKQTDSVEPTAMVVRLRCVCYVVTRMPLFTLPNAAVASSAAPSYQIIVFVVRLQNGYAWELTGYVGASDEAQLDIRRQGDN